MRGSGIGYMYKDVGAAMRLALAEDMRILSLPQFTYREDV